MTELTVIVPTYNAARTLPDTLRSLQEQTFTDWEAIVVDSGSTDTTYNIARAFGERDPRIWAIGLPLRYSRAEAFNVAMKCAAGLYVANLDADDYWLPDFVDRCLSTLRNGPPAAGVYTDFIEWYEAIGIKRIHRCPSFDRDRLAQGNFVPFSSTVFHRPVFMDPDWEPVADWDAMLRVTRRRRLVHLSEILSVRRLHAGQWSANLGGARMMFKRLLLPYRYAGLADATRAALHCLSGAVWHIIRGLPKL